MLPRLLPLTTLAALLALAAARADDAARKAVDDLLSRSAARNASVRPITDDPVSRALPGCSLFAVGFRQYPVAVAPPEPFASANVVAVTGGRAEVLRDRDALERYFRAHLAPVRDPAAARAAAHAWVRLSQELHQDGFFRFTIPADAVTADRDARTARARAVVEPTGGNKGQIDVTLAFDADGKLARADEKAAVRAGVRPICQAKKLLDPDPVVRAMAEKDILVMGQSCRDYLLEQRAAAPLQLKAALDRLWQRILDEDR